jgi:hypothetical protein
MLASIMRDNKIMQVTKKSGKGYMVWLEEGEDVKTISIIRGDRLIGYLRTILSIP